MVNCKKEVWSIVQRIPWSSIHFIWRTIFHIHHSIFNYNGSYYTTCVATTQPKIKISKQNAKTRFLFGLWWVRKNGRPFIQMFGFAINRKRHLNKCIRHRPTLFIRSNYKGSDYVSWLDFIQQSFSAKSFSAISVSETSLS